jgi:hypothetical protein
MIVTDYIDIVITESNWSYYDEFGYDVSLGDVIRIPPELLQHGSKKLLLFKCDSCGVEKNIMFKNYLKYKNKWREYHCRKCADFKRLKKNI